VIALAGVLALLQAPLDSGVFVVRQDTVEIARESFRLLPGRAGGLTLTATSRYDRGRPVVVLAPLIEFTADSQPATLQYDVADPRQPSRILGELGRGRFTVRMVARATERAREFSTGDKAVVLDDSVFALYLFAAWRAAAGPTPLTAIFPRALRRDAVQVQDHGQASTSLNRDPARLRHITVDGGGPETVHLWLDDNGRLMKLEIPSRHLNVERLAGN